MATVTGKLEVNSISEGTEVHWEISDFLSLDDDIYKSPYFQFLDTDWKLTIDPYVFRNECDIALSISAGIVRSKVTCTLGIKKTDGSLAGIKNFSISYGRFELDVCDFFTRNELEQRKSELLPSGNLTVACILKNGNGFMNVTGPDLPSGVDILLKNFKDLYVNKELCDTTLHVKDKEFKAHKTILMARSPVFAAMFKHDMSEKQSGVINIPDCDPDSFEEFLEYLYTGRLENLSFRSAFHLYKTADKYDFQELKSMCVEYMQENLSTDNVCDVVVLADEYEEADLSTKSHEIFVRNFAEILASPQWKALFKKNFSLANNLLIKTASKVKFIE